MMIINHLIRNQRKLSSLVVKTKHSIDEIENEERIENGVHNRQRSLS
jgi:hypothetical protein